MEGDISEEVLDDLYEWVDKIPMSRPKKEIKRDFADGVLVAEIIKFCSPRLVDLHNYPGILKTENKIANWHTLNRKVFRKLGFSLSDDVIKNITASKQWAIEQFLILLRRKLDMFIYDEQKTQARPRNQHDYDSSTEADREFNKVQNVQSPVRQYITGGRNSNQGHASPSRAPGRAPMRKADSLNHISRVGPGPTNHDSRYIDDGRYTNDPSPSRPAKGGGMGGGGGRVKGGGGGGMAAGGRRDMVPKLALEEKEQEILAKDETILILGAKAKRLEHLLHLKDLRIDELQRQIENMNQNLRPTANYKR